MSHAAQKIYAITYCTKYLSRRSKQNSTTAKNGKSTDSILSKPAIKFVKTAERPTTDKVETAKKPAVRYSEMYRRTSKRSTVRRNQRN
nr:hypothetical protein [Tanacetum cinerariifolium]